MSTRVVTGIVGLVHNVVNYLCLYSGVGHNGSHWHHVDGWSDLSICVIELAFLERRGSNDPFSMADHGRGRHGSSKE